MESFPQKRCHHQHPDYHESPAKAQKLLDPQQQLPSAHRLALFASDIYSMGSATAVGSYPADLAPLGCYFSLAQWQELELQALIYKYMLAGATVPLELILPIKRSFLNASPFYHHQLPQPYDNHSQTAMLQGGGYWGRSGNGMDSEPGRCRRTDGKKWRCSREAETGHKYCERHVHRGRNRSRKHVESETSSTITATSADTTTLAHSQSPPPVRDVFRFSHSGNNNVSGSTDGQKVLRHFLDDWPASRSQHQEGPDNNIPGTAVAAATSSTPNVPGNHPSDFSLKLSTPPTPTNSNWSGWGSHGDASTGGGPLAEVLRSSTSSTPAPSPSTVLQSPHYL